MTGKSRNRLIERIYDAPFEAGLGGSLLDELGRGLHSEIVVHIKEDPENREAAAMERIGLDDAAIRSYEDYYAARSVLLRESASYRDVGRIFCDHMIGNYDEYLASEAYNDYFRRHRAYHLLQVYLERSRRWVTALAFRRPSSVGRYRRHERKRFARLVPHLVNSARHARLLREQETIRRSIAEALDGLDVPVLLLDSGDRVLFANAGGEALLGQGDLLTVRNGRVVAASEVARGQLRRLLSDARSVTAEDEARPLSQVLGADRLPGSTITLQAVPVSASIAEKRAANGASVLLMASGLPRAKPDGPALARHFGLTPAEGAVVAALCEGRSVSRISADRGSSREAVRYHLKNVFQKLGVHRQAELVRLVCSTRLTD